MSTHRAGSPVANITETPEQTIATREAYCRRIAELREYAAEDEITINPASETAFWRFVDLHPGWRRGMTVLRDNGNFRVVWQDGKGGHLGVQFFGGDAVEYVVFKPRPEDGDVFRDAARATFDGVDRLVSDLDLLPLVGL